MYGQEKHRIFLQHPGFNGKSDAPPPPDYAAQAQATAQANTEAARAQTQANRVNQVTPYGSLTYSQNPTFNQAGYDQALKDYQAQMQAYQALPTSMQRATGVTPLQKIGLSGINESGNFQDYTTPGRGAAPVMPTREQFTNKDSGWLATQTLSPDQQKILEQNTSLTQGLLGTAQKGLGYVDELLSNPTIDESKLAEMPISGQSVQDAIFSRLQPQIDRQRSQLESQLANQGITRGSEAFNNAMLDQRQGENDLMTQAALQGINTGMTARQQGMQEQAYMQDRPLNIVNALRMGNQVTGPQFVSPSQQAFTPGADMLGAANSQYQAQLGDVNARNAQAAGTGTALLSTAAILL